MAETGQPYAYTGDDPVNGVDPLGLWPSLSDLNPVHDAEALGHGAATAWNDTGGKVVSAVDQHWHGIAQVATVIGSGIGTAACIAVTDGLCALALPEIGGLTNVALYAESGGQHTAGGYASAFAEGGVGGSVALLCVAACEIAGSLVLGGALVNGLWGAGQGVWDYANNGDCEHTPGGYISAGANGFAQGAIPWDQILKALHPDS